MVWIDCMCHLDQKLNSKTKNSRSHLKMSKNLTIICSRCLWVTVRYFMQIIIPRSTCRPHVESRTLKLKAHVHTLKFQRIWLKLVGNDLKWESATLCKLSYLRSTSGPHVKSWTLKLKARVHTLKFQWISLIFVGDVLEWESATLCKLSYLDPHMGPTSRARP
jgi:hypothetical protein